VIISLLVLIILAALNPQIDADIRIHLSLQDEPTIEPIAMGNITVPEFFEEPVDMCITANGTIFTVNKHPNYGLSSEDGSNSLVAWNCNGSVQWAQRFSNSDRVYFGVNTDDFHVYVTGIQKDDLFLGKYDLNGNCIWNRSWDSGYQECGFVIALADDGSIMVSGGIFELQPHCFNDSVLLCFDSQGNLVWEKRSLNSCDISCHSNFIYARFNGTLQKIRTDGTILWSTDIDDGQVFIANDDIIYVVDCIMWRSYLMVMGLSPINGEEISSSNITFTNSSQEFYKFSIPTYTIAQDGTLLLLISLIYAKYNYLLKIDEYGELVWNHTIIEYFWRAPIIRATEESRLIISGLENIDTIGVVVFDLSINSISTSNTSIGTIYGAPINIPLIGMTIVGVTLFNVGLIIFLKRKYEA